MEEVGHRLGHDLLGSAGSLIGGIVDSLNMSPRPSAASKIKPVIVTPINEPCLVCDDALTTTSVASWMISPRSRGCDKKDSAAADVAMSLYFCPEALDQSLAEEKLREAKSPQFSSQGMIRDNAHTASSSVASWMLAVATVDENIREESQPQKHKLIAMSSTPLSDTRPPTSYPQVYGDHWRVLVCKCVRMLMHLN